MDSSVLEQPFRIRNSAGDAITGDFRCVGDGTAKPIVIVCHGFTAHKDWGPFPLLGRRFAGAGFASVVFNFSHNGIGSNFRRLDEVEKFSRNTVGKELIDLRAVIDALEQGQIGGGNIDTRRIGLVGHSRGAGIAILHASSDARTRTVAGWSTIGTFIRYTSHQKEVWERQGYLPVTIRSIRTKLRYGIDMLRDLEAHREEYDLVRAVRRLNVPLLLVHGEADVTVRPAEAQSLYEASDKSRTELVLIERAGHMFGARSGSARLTPELESVTDLTVDRFRRNM